MIKMGLGTCFVVRTLLLGLNFLILKKQTGSKCKQTVNFVAHIGVNIRVVVYVIIDSYVSLHGE